MCSGTVGPGILGGALEGQEKMMVNDGGEVCDSLEDWGQRWELEWDSGTGLVFVGVYRYW